MVAQPRKMKIALFAEYHGEDAVKKNTTGFQRCIQEWMNQAGWTSHWK
jgi:hypothetical protein